MKNTLLFLLVLFGLSFSLPVRATIDDYISYYEFEDNALDTESRENLTAENGLTYLDGYILRSADLGITNTIKFFQNSTTDYASNVLSNGAHTIAGWFKIYEEPTDTSDVLFEYWVDYATGGTDNFFTNVRYYCPSSGNCSFRAQIGRDILITQEMPYNIDLGEYHHFVFTDNASGNQELYIDGNDLNLNGTASGLSATYGYLASRLTIGSFYGSGYADAILDEFKFYDRALSSIEAVDLYDSYSVPSILEITNISENDSYFITEDGATSKDILVEGTCSENITDRIAIYQDSVSNIFCGNVYSDMFDIDCVANQFSVTTTIEYFADLNEYSIRVAEIPSLVSYALYSINWCFFTPSWFDEVDINLFQSQPYNLTIIEPLEESEDYYSLQPSPNFPFQFSYNNQVDYHEDSFSVSEYTDNTYTTLLDIVIYGEVIDLDHFGVGRISSYDALVTSTEGIVSELSVERYYSAIFQNSSLGIRDRIDFITYGSSTSDYHDDTPNIVSWCDDDFDDDIFTEALKKSFCWLFIGDYRTSINNLKNQSTILFVEKVPFVYFDKIKYEWDTGTGDTDRTITIKLDAYGGFDGTPLDDFEWVLFNFDEPGWTEAHIKVYDVVENQFMPLLATLFLLVWSIRLFKNI